MSDRLRIEFADGDGKRVYESNVRRNSVRLKRGWLRWSLSDGTAMRANVDHIRVYTLEKS